MEHGVDQLRPLSLTTVADAIKVHQSTASRVASSKYMLIPSGVFELEYFSLSRSPPPKVATRTAPKRRQSDQVDNAAGELPDDVLSDGDIVRLKQRAIDFARRNATIAKRSHPLLGASPQGKALLAFVRVSAASPMLRIETGDPVHDRIRDRLHGRSSA
ncbi:hypothetical protein [Mesorhizobium sp. WSM3862]|uniref:RNA polymerase factor sigma-54 n=1 Tax=Mesorhizobium sp. WSM3862 TaxID=632858 RepID=UPI000BAEAB74|nr:hypothetical protein [Mesorhizobium sp. WSM3862]PBB98952.1 hypothetical protein CK224_04980 [Mesorhizobium sp. WSM3862]